MTTKKRVVITGAGIVSCIGNDLATVEASLREGKSGIKAVEKFTELGLRSQVGGAPEIDIEARIDRKQLRFMGDAAAYAQIALEDASRPKTERDALKKKEKALLKAHATFQASQGTEPAQPSHAAVATHRFGQLP